MTGDMLGRAVGEMLSAGLIYLVDDKTGEIVPLTSEQYCGPARWWEHGQPYLLLDSALAASARIRGRS